MVKIKNENIIKSPLLKRTSFVKKDSRLSEFKSEIHLNETQCQCLLPLKEKCVNTILTNTFS
jgi:hypothetical protein